MSKITVTVPDGDYCVAAGVKCKLIDYVQCDDSKVIKAYPLCRAYDTSLETLIKEYSHSVVKCDKCFMESRGEK